MEPQTELDAFKRFELEGWQQCVEAYDSHFGPLTAQVIEPLLAALAPKSGDRLLDIASGPGYLAAQAAALGCRVTAIDISAAMVARARTLQGKTAIEFRVGDAERLDLPANDFDAVAMNFGMLHLAHPEHAVLEAHRVLKPGGRFGFTVWSKPDQSAPFALALRAIETHGSPTVKLPTGPAFFKFSDPKESELLLAAAGFHDLNARLVSLTWKLPHADTLFEAFYRGTARTGGNLRAQPEAHRQKIREALLAAAAEYVKGDHLELPMAAWVYSGVK